MGIPYPQPTRLAIVVDELDVVPVGVEDERERAASLQQRRCVPPGERAWVRGREARTGGTATRWRRLNAARAFFDGLRKLAKSILRRREERVQLGQRPIIQGLSLGRGGFEPG